MNEQITSNQFGEQLSCLMDGELPRDQLRFLLRRLDTDAELMQCWSRYQIVRGSLRRQTAVPLRAQFAEVLMQRIAQEGAPLARRRGATLLRWAGGGAIAAAVAVVALVSTRPQVESVPNAAPPIAAVVTPAAPIVQDTHPAPLPALVNFDYAQPASFESGAISIPRFDMRHRNEAAAAGTINGFGPYVLLTAPRPQQAAPSHPDPNRPEAPPQP